MKMNLELNNDQVCVLMMAISTTHNAAENELKNPNITPENKTTLEEVVIKCGELGQLLYKSKWS
jgi:hypothetical protein